MRRFARNFLRAKVVVWKSAGIPADSTATMGSGRLPAVKQLTPLVILICGLISACGSATGSMPTQTVCRLPVTPALGTRGVGGFLSYPDGLFQRDPRSNRSYDHPMDRWLPVQRQFISRDGRSYAQLDIASRPGTKGDQGSIKVVDLPTGQARVAWTGEWAVNLVGYANAGIYFARHTPNATEFAMTTPRLWVVDPATGAARQIYPRAAPAPSDPKLWLAITQSEAWGIGVGDDGRQHIVRLDLRDESIQLWSSTVVSLLGFASDGRPVVSDQDQVAILTSPSTETTVRAVNDGFRPVIAIGDQHGIWFGDEHGRVWLASAAGRLRQVGTLPSLPSPPNPVAARPGQLQLAPVTDFLLPTGPCA